MLVIIVGGIPIAMPTVLNVTLALGAFKLAKEGAIVARMSAVEEMAGTLLLTDSCHDHIKGFVSYIYSPPQLPCAELHVAAACTLEATLHVLLSVCILQLQIVQSTAASCASFCSIHSLNELS